MPKSKKKKVSASNSIATIFRPSVSHLLIFAVSFAVIGSSYLLYRTFAATNTVTTSTGVVTHGTLNSNFNTIGWLIECPVSHSLPDDPIVHPGQPGASHMHDFWGNASTNGNSTYQTQEANGNNAVSGTYNGALVKAGTSCDLPAYAPGTTGDTASYWAPQMYANGKPVVPVEKAEIYYRAKPMTGTDFHAIPQDARILVGNHFATSIADNDALVNGQLFWECNGDTADHFQLPPTSCTQMTLSVSFPNCYDNGPMDHKGPHNSDTQHFAYSVKGNCPSGFPTKIPQVSERFKYTVPTTGMLIQFSADPGMGMGLMPGYSAHADYWNTWNPTAFQYLVDHCINAGITCGVNPITPLGP